MLNGLILLYLGLFHNMGLSILGLTLLVRLVTMPLTLKQIRQTQALTAIQPKLKELQQKYAKDRQKLAQETMALYRNAGVSPLGCLGPMAIQIPIWFGLYQALVQMLPTTPDALVRLSQQIYSFLPMAHNAIPLSSHFLWLDLANPDPTPALPILVGASTCIQQKLTTPPSADPRQQSQNNMLLWMMPLMLTFFAFSFPSGLALYWVASNVIGITIQYFTTGWQPLFSRATPTTQPSQVVPEQPDTEMSSNGDSGREPRNIRENRRRGHRAGPEGTRRKTRRGRN